MKLNLRAALDTHWRSLAPRDKNKSENLPVSMVLLLREPHFLTLEQLRSAGERAFRAPFSSDLSAPHCVFQKALFTLMKAGPHTLSFLNYTKPYGDRSDEFGKAMPMASQRQAWAQHTAWTAVDYAKGGIDLELEYAVLAGLCAEMLDANCVGVYVPRGQMFIPDDGSLLPELRRIASSRHPGVTQGRNRVH
ncbi:MAG: hypothetical protein ABR902_15180 [Candidatus Korobacteraceae bacterium]|jgi:hypothetical protein